MPPPASRSGACTSSGGELAQAHHKRHFPGRIFPKIGNAFPTAWEILPGIVVAVNVLTLPDFPWSEGNEAEYIIQPLDPSLGVPIMRKPTSFCVRTLSILMFLSLACAACGRNTVQSAAGAARAPARDPVTQVYALAWAPDGARL